MIGLEIGSGLTGGVIQVSSDPDGTLTAQRGTLAINTTTGTLWQNTTGSTVWQAISRTRGTDTLLGVDYGVPWQSGRYYVLPKGTASNSNTLTNGTLRVYPHIVTTSVSISRIGAEIVNIGDVGSKLRLCIYGDDGTGRPGSLILDAGQILADSATVQEITLGTPTVLGPGRYHFGGVVQSVVTTQPNVRCIPLTAGFPSDDGTTMPGTNAANFGFFVNGVTGACPSTFTVGGVAGAAPRVFVKVT